MGIEYCEECGKRLFGFEEKLCYKCKAELGTTRKSDTLPYKCKREVKE